ncbi:unnamed protein product [Polarella glacialis]|uniref:Uncharacterized protein n=1 Tax=Polarella glacialis TaxID=89957 RepID=A0A813L4H8_POLGL|nr:unnamed protein product [Polarella glacialis]
MQVLEGRWSELPPNFAEEPEDMLQSKLFPLPPGAAVVRDLRLWHGGTPNLSGQTRFLPSVELMSSAYAAFVAGPHSFAYGVPCDACKWQQCALPRKERAKALPRALFEKLPVQAQSHCEAVVAAEAEVVPAGLRPFAKARRSWERTAGTAPQANASATAGGTPWRASTQAPAGGTSSWGHAASGSGATASQAQVDPLVADDPWKLMTEAGRSWGQGYASGTGVGSSWGQTAASSSGRSRPWAQAYDSNTSGNSWGQAPAWSSAAGKSWSQAPTSTSATESRSWLPAPASTSATESRSWGQAPASTSATEGRSWGQAPASSSAAGKVWGQAYASAAPTSRSGRLQRFDGGTKSSTWGSQSSGQFSGSHPLGSTASATVAKAARVTLGLLLLAFAFRTVTGVLGFARGRAALLAKRLASAARLRLLRMLGAPAASDV